MTSSEVTETTDTQLGFRDEGQKRLAGQQGHALARGRWTAGGLPAAGSGMGGCLSGVAQALGDVWRREHGPQALPPVPTALPWGWPTALPGPRVLPGLGAHPPVLCLRCVSINHHGLRAPPDPVPSGRYDKILWPEWLVHTTGVCLSQFQRPNQEQGAGGFSVRQGLAARVIVGRLFTVSSHGRRGEHTSSGSFYKSTNPTRVTQTPSKGPAS